MIQLIKGDCIIEMPKIKDKSIDMILADLPYGTTACKWDTIIPFKPLWKQYERIIKDNGAIVLFASQPFTSALIMSNINLFRYELIWEKPNPSNPLLAGKQPLKNHENICIFYKKQPDFKPVKILRLQKDKRNSLNRQVVFYKLLLNQYNDGQYNMSQGTLDFIEPHPDTHEFEREIVSVCDADVDKLREEINVFANDILSGEFLNQDINKKYGDKSLDEYIKLLKILKK